MDGSSINSIQIGALSGDLSCTFDAKDSFVHIHTHVLYTLYTSPYQISHCSFSGVFQAQSMHTTGSQNPQNWCLFSSSFSFQIILGLLLSERAGHIPRTSLIHSLMWKSCTDSARAQSYDAYEVGFFAFWLDGGSIVHLRVTCERLAFLWACCLSRSLLVFMM